MARPKRTEAQWDEINRHEHEQRELRGLGHRWMLTVQDRYGEDDAVPTNRTVWIACSCGWSPARSFPDERTALAEFPGHDPAGRPVADAGQLVSFDDAIARGRAEDEYLNALLGEPRQVKP